jgi:hypothetical protein
MPDAAGTVSRMVQHRLESPDWIDGADIVFSSSLDFNASAEDVWERIADHQGWPEWFTSLDKVEVTGDPTGVGGKRRVTVKRLGINEEFTAWTENEQFSFAIVKSPLFFLETMAEDVRIEAVDAGCRVVYRQGIAARWGLRWLAKVGLRQLPQQTAEALQNLKTLVEA